MEWDDNLKNLRNLAEYIIDRDGEIDTVHFLEKPWHYHDDWDEYQTKIEKDLEDKK